MELYDIVLKLFNRLWEENIQDNDLLLTKMSMGIIAPKEDDNYYALHSKLYIMHLLAKEMGNVTLDYDIQQQLKLYHD